MNQKQLANVLIKILGLSLIAHGVSYIATGIINAIQTASDAIYSSSFHIYHAYWMLLLDLIPVAIGIYLIVRSRWLTEKLFKDE